MKHRINVMYVSGDALWISTHRVNAAVIIMKIRVYAWSSKREISTKIYINLRKVIFPAIENS